MQLGKHQHVIPPRSGPPMFSYLIDAFSGAGMAFMWAITAIFAFGLAVFIERTWFLLIRWRVDTTELARLLAHGEPDQVLALTSHAPLGAVLQAGLESPDPDAAWDAMGAAAAEAEHRIRMRIPYLATIGNVATMLGLLGTVYGLILAFSSLENAPCCSPRGSPRPWRPQPMG